MIGSEDENVEGVTEALNACISKLWLISNEDPNGVDNAFEFILNTCVEYDVNPYYVMSGIAGYWHGVAMDIISPEERQEMYMQHLEVIGEEDEIR